MLRLIEIETLEHRLGCYGSDDKICTIYVSLVEKFKNGEKMDGRAIILSHDAGHPQNKNHPVMIGGSGIFDLIPLFKNNLLKFDINNYDQTDFPTCHLATLVPKYKNKNDYKFPRDIYNWNYDCEWFAYEKVKTAVVQRVKTIIENRNGVPLKIHHVTPKKDTQRIIVPARQTQLHLAAPKPIVEIDITPPKPTNIPKFVAYD